jgi:hypothetical protein
MDELRVGESVLVTRPGGVLVFEPVLGFLHAVRGGEEGASHLAVRHEFGEVQATQRHLVLTAEGGDKPVGELKPGDLLLVAKGSGGQLEPSAVLAVRPVNGIDAYAPLTASGTIVVDGVAASNYASTASAGDAYVTHAVAHAFLFPVRAFNCAGLSSLWTLVGAGTRDTQELHPFLDLAYRHLKIDTLHALLLGSK